MGRSRSPDFQAAPAARLELTWVGKDQRSRPEPCILFADEAQSCPPGNREPNLLIHGDNLPALKALEPRFSGAVKCCFIDPPYNTGSAFAQYDDGLEHSIWLGLMRDRLELIRTLLAEDGSIWITVDDAESHYLKVLCDEIFGRRNFVMNVIWEKKFSPQNDSRAISRNHDHILVYARNARKWRPNLLARSDRQTAGFKNPDEDPRGPWISCDYTCAKSRAERPNLFYPIVNPNTGEEIWPKPTRVWAFDHASHERNLANSLVWWGVKGKNPVPRLKKFVRDLRAGTVPTSVWRNEDVGNNQEAKREVLAFNATDPFATPKPERLIRRVLEIATQPGDLVLDSFGPALRARWRTKWAGSGSWWSSDRTATPISCRA